MLTKKPWGSEELLCLTGVYVIKKICLNKGCRCSLQYHKDKTETIYVVNGILKIFHLDNYAEYFEGDVLTILPWQKHRMIGVTKCVYIEVSTPELDDVVRLDDDYGRV